MKKTLLLRLQAPMQSWSNNKNDSAVESGNVVPSAWGTRGTSLYPTKSGVIGLCCAALGRDRAEPVDDLAALEFGLRVEKGGILKRDFQMSRGVVNAKGMVEKNGTQNVVSNRYYLADASFLVGLYGNSKLLEDIHAALRNPHWALSLGRKSFVPASSVWLEDGIRDAKLADALTHYPHTQGSQLVLTVDKSHPNAVQVQDEVIAPFSQRIFGNRWFAFTELE